MNASQPQLVYDSSNDDQRPTLSIVTLCYNTGQYIVEGMGSIFHQLDDNVEHVILDDCSTDESVKFMVDYAISCEYPVRIYMNPENCGITESFSRILKIATGEFIAICADDLFLPDRVQHDLEIIESLPESSAGFYSLVLPFHVNADGEKDYHHSPLGKIDGLDGQSVLTSNELSRRLQKGNFIPAMSMCLRKSIYEQFPQDTTYFIEDYPMWAKLAIAGWSIVYSPQITMLYRRADHSVQRTHSLRVDFDAIRVQLEILSVRLSAFDERMKKMWFRVVCDADDEMIDQLVSLCHRTSNGRGILLFLAQKKLSNRLRWIFSNISLRFNFWKYI